MLNGFINRFMFICVERSRLLPHGGDREALDIALQPLLDRLARVLAFHPSSGSSLEQPFECRLADSARDFWAEIYAALAEAKEGMQGAATARSEPIVLRLAMIYALLDESVEIQRTHLESALAVWRYAEASVAYVFGSTPADSLITRVLVALIHAGANGLTRDQLRDALHRNNKSREIKSVLQQLERRGLARKERVATGHRAGRPAELWRVVLPLADPEDEDEDD